MKIKALLSLVFCTICAVTRAVTFNGADGSGSGDLSLAANWEGGTAPGSSSNVSFTKSGVLESSETFSPQWIYFTGTMLEWVVTNAHIKTAYTGSADAFLVGVGDKDDQRAGNTLVVAKNARIDVPRGVVVIGESSKALEAGTSGGNKIVIAAGGVFHARYDFHFGAGYSPTNALIVEKGGVLDTTWDGNGFRFAKFGAYSYGNTFDLYGSYFATNNYNNISIGVGSAASNNVVTCHEGSYLKTNGNIYFGGGYAGGADFGDTGSCGNRFIVKKGAKVIQGNANSRSIYVGTGRGSRRNAMIIEDGSDVSFTAPLYVGYLGSENFLCVSNGTDVLKTTIGASASAHRNVYVWRGAQAATDVNLNNVKFGAGTNNEFRIEGKDVVFKKGNPAFSSTAFKMNAGCGNKFVVRDSTVEMIGNITSSAGCFAKGNEIVFDGSIWNHKHDSGGNGTMTFEDKVTLTLRNSSTANLSGATFKWGNSVTDAQNVLNVLSGSVMNFSAFRLYQSNNRIVISNAVMNVSSALTLPYYNGGSYTGMNTNNVIRFEGVSPRLAGTSTMTFLSHAVDGVVDYGKTVFEYALPGEAYAAAPLTATSISIGESNRLKVVLPETLPASVTYTLAEATSGTISIGDIDTFSADLPGNCTLRLSSDSKKLLLRAKSTAGLKLIIR